jgi:hypothetical protein
MSNLMPLNVHFQDAHFEFSSNMIHCFECKDTLKNTEAGSLYSHLENWGSKDYYLWGEAL